MLIVQKFGGSSVADADKVRNVARIITDAYRQGHSVVAVVSAQGDTTDDLIEKAREINPKASKREMDMLLSAGEQMSASLLAMAIEAMGLPVVSLSRLADGDEDQLQLMETARHIKKYRRRTACRLEIDKGQYRYRRRLPRHQQI